MKPAFDAHAVSYHQSIHKAIGFMGRKHDFYTSVKAHVILDTLRMHRGESRNLHVLDVGCGVGATDSLLQHQINHLVGVDVSTASLDQARQRNPDVRYESFDGRHLPFPNSSFDAAFLICVLHHVEEANRIPLMQDVRRILKPNGLVMVFEHNPYHPLTRLVVARCDLDRDASLLSRRQSLQLFRTARMTVRESHYILFLPFRRKWPGGRGGFFKQVPAGAQYCVTGSKHAEGEDQHETT